MGRGLGGGLGGARARAGLGGLGQARVWGLGGARAGAGPGYGRGQGLGGARAELHPWRQRPLLLPLSEGTRVSPAPCRVGVRPTPVLTSFFHHIS